MSNAVDQKSVLKSNKFYATTNLLGFNLIYKSNSRYESIFWYVIVGIFSIITAYNVVDLVNQFNSKATVTHVSMQKLGKTHKLKPFHVVLQFVLPELNKEFANSTKVFHFENPYNKSLSFELNEALSKMPTKESFVHTKWDYILFPLLTRYFTFMSTCEFANTQCSKEKVYLYTHRKKRFQWFLEALLVPEMGEVRDAIAALLNHTEKINITTQELADMFSIKILQWLDLRIYDPEIPHTQAANLWQREPWRLQLKSIESLVDGAVKFVYEMERLEPLPVGYWGTQHGLFLKVSFESIKSLILESGVFGANANEDTVNDWYRQFDHQIKVVLGEITIAPEADATPSLLRTWSVRVTSSFQAIKDCSPADLNSEHCTEECMRQQLHFLCRCEPIFLQGTGMHRWRSCTATDYMECMQGGRGHFRDNCTDVCPPDCELDLFELRVAYEVGINNYSIGLGMYLVGSERALFLEHYSQTWQSFLAELGGTFDFWLGASVVGCVHILVYMAKQIAYMFKSDTKVGGNLRSLASTKRRREVERKSKRRKNNLFDPNENTTNMEDMNRLLLDLRWRVIRVEQHLSKLSDQNGTVEKN